MLVVIAIIATLAGISFPVAKSMINRGKEKETQLRMREFVTAVNDFNNDNGHLPFVNGTYPTGDQEIEGQELVDLVNILLGEDSTEEGGNTKSKKYLDMPAAKNNRNGLIYGTGTSVDEIVDGWGKDFFVVIDYDLDSEITQSHTSDIDNTIEGQTVIMISKGADGEADGDDDVFSWIK